MAAEEFDPARIRALLRQLTAKYVEPETTEKTFESAILLLDSAIATAPSLKGIESLVQALLTRLMREGRQNDAMACAKIAANLKMSDGISNTTLWSILYLLSALKGTGSEPVAKLPHTPKDLMSVGRKLAAERSPAVQSFLPSALKESPFEPGKPVDAVDRAVPTPRESRAATNGPVAHVSHSVRFEALILEDLLLIVQGADGRNIKFAGKDGDENVAFGPSVAPKLSRPMENIASAIAELGFLFRLIRRRLDEIVEEKHGLVLLNFSRAVDRELDSYYKSIVSLRSSAQMDVELANAANATSAAGDAQPAKLTLRRLYVWAESEKEKLRCIARICDEITALKGGQVLAHLRMYRMSALAPDIQTMLARIFSRSAAPLNRMLQRWLTEGVIEDAHGEFFIAVDAKVAASAALAGKVAHEGGHGFDTMIGGPNAASAASNRIWWGLFRVRSSMLPSSRNRKIAEKALLAGKSIAFLRRCCGDSAWVDSMHTPAVSALLPKSLAGCDDRDMLGFVGLTKLVEKADESASRRLMTLFFDKFDLSHHFAAIKRYLLLSQGDFTQSLIDSLAGVLDGDSAVLRSSVTSIVDGALRSASSFNEETDADILQRLNVKILQQTGDKQLGWDVFSLTYRVEDAPLNTIFSPKVMDAYLLIFRFLWRLKRMDHLLSGSYVSLCAHKCLRDENDPFSERVQQLNSSLRKAHYLRMKMMHLVQNIEYYCTFEVLEGSWTILERDMAASTNISALIDAHSKYLVAIKERTLLSDRSRKVLKALNETLDTIPVFHEEILRLAAELAPFSGHGALSPKSSVSPTAADGTDDETKVSVHDALDALEKQFDAKFAVFLNGLRSHASIVDNCLFLAFRLDFNGYFGNRRMSLGSLRISP